MPHRRTAQDLRHAIGVWLRRPGTAVLRVLNVAVCIGANTAMFAVLNAALLSPLQYRDADRIVQVFATTPNGARNVTSTENFLDWTRESRAFEYLAPFR